MHIWVDADACPVVALVERAARRRGIPVTLLCDTNHVLTSDELVNRCGKGDLVVTQDYGVAAMALGKGAWGIHQSGKWYTQDNIGALLMDRHLAQKARRAHGKHHLKGPKKRTPEDDERFAASLERLLDAALGGQP